VPPIASTNFRNKSSKNRDRTFQFGLKSRIGFPWKKWQPLESGTIGIISSVVVVVLETSGTRTVPIRAKANRGQREFGMPEGQRTARQINDSKSHIVDFPHCPNRLVWNFFRRRFGAGEVLQS
jgi:hypothetical protein